MRNVGFLISVIYPLVDQSSSHLATAKPDAAKRQISEENWEAELAQENTNVFREKSTSSKESSVEKEV